MHANATSAGDVIGQKWARFSRGLTEMILTRVQATSGASKIFPCYTKLDLQHIWVRKYI